MSPKSRTTGRTDPLRARIEFDEETGQRDQRVVLDREARHYSDIKRTFVTVLTALKAESRASRLKSQEFSSCNRAT